MTNSSILKQSARLIRAGEKQQASNLLKQLLQADPSNETAWLWLSACVESKSQKRYCLQRVLALNPDHPTAQRLLANLENTTTTPSLPVTPAPPAKTETRKTKRKFNPFILLLLLLLCGGSTLFNAKLRSLQSQLKSVRTNHQQLVFDYNILEENNRQLEIAQDELIEKHNQLVDDYNQLIYEYDRLNDIAIKPPYIYVYGRNVKLAYRLLDDTLYHWEIPFDYLENSLEDGHAMRVDLPTKKVRYDNGEVHSVIDVSYFVNPEPFIGFSKSVYAQSESDDEFIRNIWNIMGQLTTYVDENNDIPRFPLETLLAGGGDCEDTSILMASMIKAAELPWETKLMYIDSDHPNDPQEINHVILIIDTGSSHYRIETTSKTQMTPYPNGVTGWYALLD